jgi:hypothetical protein
VVAGVALVAMLCLSSSLLASIVGGATVLVVAVDMFAHRKSAIRGDRGDGSADDTPDRLTVDLSRRP